MQLGISVASSHCRASCLSSSYSRGPHSDVQVRLLVHRAHDIQADQLQWPMHSSISSPQPVPLGAIDTASAVRQFGGLLSLQGVVFIKSVFQRPNQRCSGMYHQCCYPFDMLTKACRDFLPYLRCFCYIAAILCYLRIPALHAQAS